MLVFKIKSICDNGATILRFGIRNGHHRFHPGATMTTTTCPACASSNPDDAAFCNQCGSPLYTLTDRSAPGPSRPVGPADDAAPPPPAQQLINADQPVVQPVASTGSERKQMPCLVKGAGGFFGCLFGAIVGLCLSLICVMPVMFAISGGHSSYGLQFAIILVIILVIVTTLLGIILGPGFLGRILKSIGDTFK
jgi:zinc-ribbon domain